MTTTNFIDKQTVIQAAWANDVNDHAYDEAGTAHTSAHITYQPSGTGAVATDVQSKLREFVSRADFGGQQKTLIEFSGVTSDNVVFNPTLNSIAGDCSAGVISGGGTAGNSNLIGYQEYRDVITGDGSTTSWTTTFDVSNTSDVQVILVRADLALIDVSLSCNIVMSGSKAVVTYPLAGHFVNDGPNGTEGTNPAVLSTQSLRLIRRTRTEITGSGCDLCGIYGGYDNLISTGIMSHVVGAHHRIYSGNHNSIFGGSYGTISDALYSGIWGGTNNTISGSGSGSVIVGGDKNTVSTRTGYIFAGSTNTVNGAFATAIGGYQNQAIANGAVVLGRSNIVSASDSFSAGLTNTVGAVYSGAFGLSNSISGSGYSFAFGRSNVVSGQYSGSSGYGNTSSKTYSYTFGKDAVSTLSGSETLGGGKFAAAGDCQVSRTVIKASTTDAVAAWMSAAVDATYLVVPTDTTWAFSCLIVARRTDADNESAAYKVEGCIDNNAGTVALVGTPVVTVLAEDTAAWNVVVSANNTSKALVFAVIGESGKSIRWVGNLELAEVSG